MSDQVAASAGPGHDWDLPAADGANVTGLILAGGAGRRLDGADKPLYTYRGRPLIEHVLASITPQVQEIVISANRNLERYSSYGRVVQDQLPGHAGPLAGVAAALGHIEHGWILVCPGDAPALPADLLACLGGALQRAAPAQPRIAVPDDGRRLQPLPLLLHSSLREALGRYLERGARSVHGWLETVGYVAAVFPDPRAFRSLNHPEDFLDEDHSVICDCR